MGFNSAFKGLSPRVTIDRKQSTMNEDRTTAKMDTAISSKMSVLINFNLIVPWFKLVLRSGFLLREYTPQLFVTHRLLHGQSSAYNAEENRTKSATFHSGTRRLDVGGGIQHVTASFGFQQHFRRTFQSGDVMLRR